MDALSRAVVAKLGELRGPKDPLGELAQAILSGETCLRQAASSAAYAETLSEAAAQTRDSFSALTDDERADLARTAELIRHADKEPRGEPRQ